MAPKKKARPTKAALKKAVRKTNALTGPTCAVDGKPVGWLKTKLYARRAGQWLAVPGVFICEDHRRTLHRGDKGE